jgi:hypothetical protein
MTVLKAAARDQISAGLMCCGRVMPAMVRQVEGRRVDGLDYATLTSDLTAIDASPDNSEQLRTMKSWTTHSRTLWIAQEITSRLATRTRTFITDGDRNDNVFRGAGQRSLCSGCGAEWRLAVSGDGADFVDYSGSHRQRAVSLRTTPATTSSTRPTAPTESALRPGSASRSTPPTEPRQDRRGIRGRARHHRQLRERHRVAQGRHPGRRRGQQQACRSCRIRHRQGQEGR